jgi:hypothetical protein
MTEPEFTQSEVTRDRPNVAGVRRRIGFVALLWWISAGAGTIGVMHGMPAGRVRLLFIGISWFLAILFSYAWWHVGKASLPE